MRIQTFSVKYFVCKIIKTKNCVPFEVQYYSSCEITYLMFGSNLYLLFYFECVMNKDTDAGEYAVAQALLSLRSSSLK